MYGYLKILKILNSIALDKVFLNNLKKVPRKYLIFISSVFFNTLSYRAYLGLLFGGGGLFI